MFRKVDVSSKSGVADDEDSISQWHGNLNAALQLVHCSILHSVHHIPNFSGRETICADIKKSLMEFPYLPDSGFSLSKFQSNQ